LVVLPGVAFMISTAGILVKTLLGSQWADVTPIFIGLSVAGLLQTANSPANWLFLSQGRTREYMRWGFISAATSVASFLFALPFGPIGVASAYSIRECLRTPALWWLVGRSGPVGHRDAARVIVPHLAAAVASIVGVYLLHHWMIARLFGDLPNLLACFALSY